MPQAPEADLSIPRSAELRPCYQAGYAASLQGASRYANPYAAAIERAAEEGTRPHGVQYARLETWWAGWHAAASLLGSGAFPVVASPRRARGRVLRSKEEQCRKP